MNDEDILKAQIRQQLRVADVSGVVKKVGLIIGILMVAAGLLFTGYWMAKKALGRPIEEKPPAMSSQQGPVPLVGNSPKPKAIAETEEDVAVEEPVLAENRIIDYRSMFGVYEGETNKVYMCPTGHPTVGIGHSLQIGSRIPEWMVEPLFLYDLHIAMEDADYAVSKYDLHIDQVRYAALVNIAYMAGRGGLMRYKNLLGALQKGHYKTAALEWQKSKPATTAGDLRRMDLTVMLRDGKTDYWKAVGGEEE